MDDVIKFTLLVVIVFISGLQLYCTKVVCSPEVKQYYL